MAKAWIERNIYVDMETGEIIDYLTAKNQYDVTRKNKPKIIYSGKYNTKQHICQCRRKHEQLGLFKEHGTYKPRTD